jgi:sugar phosphate isomerase/epimerase
MKLAFSTLGCLDWDLDTIIRRALDYGFHGVDFRGYLKALDVSQTPEFSTQATETARALAAAGLEVPCFSTSVGVCDSDRQQPASLAEIRRYAEICQLFGARYLRVFGRGESEPHPRAIERFGRNVQPLLRVAEDHGVVLLLETHDQWTDSGVIRSVIEQVDSPALRVLWDVHHPLVASGESLEATWANLGSLVCYTHWKDATAEDRLCLVGEGVLPLAAWHRLLAGAGYDGYCTLEWERRWHPELAEPEVAFPRFVRFMNRLADDIEPC